MNPQSPFRFMQVIMVMAGVYFLFSGASSIMKTGLTLPSGLLMLIAAAFFGLFAFDYQLEKKKLAAKDTAERASEDSESTAQQAQTPDPEV